MMPSVHADNIPAELRALKQWVCWRYDARGAQSTKVPCTVTGALASSIDPKTWCSFEEALTASAKFAGIGFVFSENDPYCGVDLDGCLADDGHWLWGEDFVQWLNTYAEVSPSGHGVKLILRATKPKHARCVKRNADPTHGGAIEIYDRARFFAITGQRIASAPHEIAVRQNELNDLCDHLWPQRIVASTTASPTVVADADVERRATAYLQAMPPAISGQSGHNATYAAATALVHGFGLSPDRALELLNQHFNPRCEPPWSVRELEHKINDAATKPHDVPFGWLRDASQLQERGDVDISHLVKSEGTDHNEDNEQRNSAKQVIDPGPIPESLLHVPGFVSEVMHFSLENAPYPSVPLAFCGAMALQSFLCGRKVSDPGDLRPNIYLLALASSGTGKDFPRKVNSRVLFETGQVASLGDKFASGEGIQDALLRTNAMLFQNDEMDGVLRQINLDRESKRESIPNILLTLYTSASEVYPVRTKANQREASHIDQPHVTIFGTATPRYFYESLSQRMLTNGFFARLIIVDVGKRSTGQTPGSTRQLTESILQTAHWWSDFHPGQRKNLLEVHPEPKVIAYSEDALQGVRELQRQADREYELAHDSNDEVGRVAWSRTCENAKKLALIYACSANHEDPVIDRAAIEWATTFAIHQTRRQLYLATVYVAENPFHGECLKLLRILQEAGGQMARNKLMRAMRCKMQDFDQIVSTLITQGDIALVELRTKTKSAIGYQLI